MFSATGKAPSGGTQKITWNGGRFEGRKNAIAEFLAFSNEHESVRVANMLMNNDAKDPLAAMALTSMYFRTRVDYTGDVPQLPSVPDGAIA